jgi:hypothetical protein
MREIRYKRGQIPVYKVRDLADDPIEGTLYESEIQKLLSQRMLPIEWKKILKGGAVEKPKKFL